MPKAMIRAAARAAYGEGAMPENLSGITSDSRLERVSTPGIRKKKTKGMAKLNGSEYQLGDSVMVYPDKKIGIVCQTANEKGVLRVQMAEKKIWVNHKRIKLHVAAEELYPEDYDFSIIFDSVKNRKLKHQMDRGKIIEEAVVLEP